MYISRVLVLLQLDFALILNLYKVEAKYALYILDRTRFFRAREKDTTAIGYTQKKLYTLQMDVEI